LRGSRHFFYAAAVYQPSDIEGWPPADEDIYAVTYLASSRQIASPFSLFSAPLLTPFSTPIFSHYALLRYFGHFRY